MLVRAMLLGWKLDYVAPSKTPLSFLNKQYDFCAMVPLQVSASMSALSSIKTLLIGGAPVGKDLESSLQGLDSRVFESYGMTETASHIALKPLNESARKSVDGDTGLFKTTAGADVAIDDRGCLVVHAEYISEEPIITNDLVELVGSDQFLWLGRLDHVINSGGIKLIPENIEAKLSPMIEERFILTGIPDPELGERLVLVIEGSANKDISPTKIKKSSELQAYEIPKEIYYLQKFPETKTGKLRRKDITQMIRNHS